MAKYPVCWMLGLTAVAVGGAELRESEVREAVVQAVVAMDERCARHGGYVWSCDVEGRHRTGEAPAGPSTAWVQPPGTPRVGEAILDAWEATGDRRCLDAARAAGEALVRGQLHSGGWFYRIEFEPQARKAFDYRVDGGAAPRASGPTGWESWRKRENKGNRSMLDDDTTQSALRFLTRLESQDEVEDPELRECVEYGIKALLGTQYPAGAWSHNFDAFPETPPDAGDYPVLEASYPEEWPRQWPNAWNACYHLNDNITADCIRTLLLAHEIHGSETALEAAKRGGDFLIRAQMPEPQPAWCQQYDKTMTPVWERKFEPPAISGWESQGAIEVLLELHHRTGEARFLEPVDAALAYLKKSRLPDGRLARYYEFRTNRPLYFDGDYRLTHDDRDAPDHYSFKVESRLEALERGFARCREGKAPALSAKPSDERVRVILGSIDESGLWLEPGTLRDADGRKVVPDEGVVFSRTFAANVSALCAWLGREL